MGFRSLPVGGGRNGGVVGGRMCDNHFDRCTVPSLIQSVWSIGVRLTCTRSRETSIGGGPALFPFCHLTLTCFWRQVSSDIPNFHVRCIRTYSSSLWPLPTSSPTSARGIVETTRRSTSTVVFTLHWVRSLKVLLSRADMPPCATCLHIAKVTPAACNRSVV